MLNDFIKEVSKNIKEKLGLNHFIETYWMHVIRNVQESGVQEISHSLNWRPGSVPFEFLFYNCTSLS